MFHVRRQFLGFILIATKIHLFHFFAHVRFTYIFKQGSSLIILLILWNMKWRWVGDRRAVSGKWVGERIYERCSYNNFKLQVLRHIKSSLCPLQRPNAECCLRDNIKRIIHTIQSLCVLKQAVHTVTARVKGLSGSLWHVFRYVFWSIYKYLLQLIH